ncbi:MAG TPA: hypothetical protein VN253_07290 [Kofleriaceae bacterium]|nr:hypothetical protein [Kofleriaceae bacterium]
MRSPFPLQWPDDTPRTKHRRNSIFQTSFASAREHVLRQCDLLGAANVVITSMLPTNRLGQPIAASNVGDPGIAVWFVLDGQERVFACDRWYKPEANLQAIAKTLEAMRGVERWGVAGAQKRLFAGFAALPPGGCDAPDPPAPSARPWREVLGGAWPAELGAAELLVIAKTRHRAAIAKAHPDAGGDTALAAELNAALDQAVAELAPL